MTEKKTFTVKELRVFGLILGTILAFAGRKFYLKGWTGAPAFWTVAGLLIVTALVRPTALTPIVRRWMKVAGVLAVVNTFAVLSVVYYLILTPFAALMRLKDGDLLDERPKGEPSYWKPKKTGESLETYERQF